MRAVLVVVFLLLAMFPLHAEEVLRAPVPDWVELLPIPEEKAEDMAPRSDGFHYLLVDRQFRWVGETRESLLRLVWKIDGRSGLDQGGTLQLPFDPSSETLALNRVEILRDGLGIDLRDDAVVGVYRREENLGSGVVDGRLTLHLEVPGLQVGDVVDVAVSRSSAAEMAIDGFADTVDMGFGMRTVQTRLLLHWPKQLPFHVRLHHPEKLAYSESDEGATVRREWLRGDLPVFPSEESAPPEYRFQSAVEFGPHSDWSPIVAAFLPHYGRVPPLPAAWQERAAAIAAASPDPARRTIIALRMVQRDIRYLSNVVGPGAYIARDPEDTLRTLYGDCKDKSVLLASLLSALGIEAQVALTSVTEGSALGDRLPTLDAFDHMMVRAQVDGEWYWMDPTASNEGGNLQTAAVPDYRFALPIAPGSADLLEIVLTPASRSRLEQLATYSFGRQGLRLGIRTTYYGASANWARRQLHFASLEATVADNIDKLAQNYPGIASDGAPRVIDDTEANILSMEETYFLAQDSLNRFGLMASFPFLGWGFSFGFPSESGVGRRSPLSLFHPYAARIGVLVTGAPVDLEPPGPVEFDNSAFSYRFGGATLLPGQMSLTWSYASKAHSVPAQDAEAVLRDARRTEDFALWSYDLTIPKALEILRPGTQLLPP